MALKFEYIYDLSDISIEPDVVSKGYITNEPSGALLNYIMYNKDEAAEKVWQNVTQLTSLAQHLGLLLRWRGHTATKKQRRNCLQNQASLLKKNRRSKLAN